MAISLGTFRAPTTASNIRLGRMVTAIRSAPPPPASPSRPFLGVPLPRSLIALPAASSAVRNFAPPAVSQVIPVKAQSTPSTSPTGMLSNLALLSQPRASFLPFRTSSSPVGGLRSPTVDNSPANVLDRMRIALSGKALAPYNPPAAPQATAPVDQAVFQSAQPPAAAPPASTSSSTLPGGGFDPYASTDGSTNYPGSGDAAVLNAGQPDPLHPGFDLNGNPLPPAAPSSTGSIVAFAQANPLLAGGLALGGLFLLSKIFK